MPDEPIEEPRALRGMNMIARITGGLETAWESDDPKLNSIKVADEVWIATAMLQKEDSEQCCWDEEDIIGKIVENQEEYFNPEKLAIRYKAIINHIRQHSVAYKSASPARLRMLSRCLEEPFNHKRNRVVYIDNDQHDWDEDRTGKMVPVLAEVPPEYHDITEELLQWWIDQGGNPDAVHSADTPPITKGQRLNQIRLRYDIYPFLVNQDEFELLKQIKDFEIDSSITPYGSRYKIGYAISLMWEPGNYRLYEAFRESLTNLPDPQAAMIKYEDSYGKYEDELNKKKSLPPEVPGAEVPGASLEENPVLLTISLDLLANKQYEIYEKAMDNNELATASAALKEIALLYGYHNDV